MHPGGGRVRPGVDASEGTGCLQYLPPCVGRGANIWREVQALPHHNGTPGRFPTAPYPKYVGKTDEVTPSVNETTDREIAPESMQFDKRYRASYRRSGRQILPKALSRFQKLM